MRLKILFVAPFPPPAGGISTWMKRLLASLKDRSDVSCQLINTSVKWRRLTQLNPIVRFIGGALQAIRVYLQTMVTCNSYRPDVVHVCTSGGPSFLRDRLLLNALRRRGVPRGLHVHMGMLPGIVARGGIGWWMARSAMREASMVMVLDDASKTALDRNISGPEIVKCPNFIDTTEVEGVTNGYDCKANPHDTDILFVGHALPSKGVEDLVRACGNIPGIRLAVVGPIENAYAERLTDLANRLGVNLRLTGEKDRVGVLRDMVAAKAIALPSYTEGFPNVVLEAMAVGIPVIATPVGAIPEILGFDTSSPWGREVKVGDISGLREALADLLSSPRKWKEMGIRAREIVRARFDVGVVLPTFLTHLERAVRVERSKPKKRGNFDCVRKSRP